MENTASIHGLEIAQCHFLETNYQLELKNNVLSTYPKPGKAAMTNSNTKSWFGWAFVKRGTILKNSNTELGQPCKSNRGITVQFEDSIFGLIWIKWIFRPWICVLYWGCWLTNFKRSVTMYSSFKYSINFCIILLFKPNQCIVFSSCWGNPLEILRRRYKSSISYNKRSSFGDWGV